MLVGHCIDIVTSMTLYINIHRLQFRLSIIALYYAIISIDEPYTEQVILLSGQGIWYEKPEPTEDTLHKANFTMNLEPPRNFTRRDFGLQDEWFIYFVPQSVFKIHPFFDQILAEIVRLQPRGHVVVTGTYSHGFVCACVCWIIVLYFEKKLFHIYLSINMCNII